MDKFPVVPEQRFTITRRHLIRNAGLLGAMAAMPGFLRAAIAADKTLTVFSPLAPDPAPPGVAQFSLDAMKQWEQKNGVDVSYDAVAWVQLHNRMATSFAAGDASWDVVYMCGWVPEFADSIIPFVDSLPAELIADLPESSFKTVTWNQKRMGTVFTLSLLTLFYNDDHLKLAGITAPPKNWDELKGYAKELTRDGRYGWTMNYGQASDIGGTASYWMCFLQQAGGRMWKEDGQPDFNNSAGVDALQVMVDLMPYTDPGAISYIPINDATNVFNAGNASMMMNWPFMWKVSNDPAQSQIVGKVRCAPLPAGPAGTASIDGTDAWTITKTSKNPALARQLIEFYLSKDIQRQMTLDTGWLPIRKSVLADPAIQKAYPNAAALLEQAQHPYDSFLTPDYSEVTQAIGTEIQLALQKQKTAAQAITDAYNAVTDIVKKRSAKS